MKDTIVAVATASGIGAISIIRVSGNEAFNIVNNIFKGRDLTKAKTHTINYGHIYNNEDGSIIDEVLVMVMRQPKTFTKEHTVEINSHGGIVTTNQILELLLKNGARLAEPGEFTKRAFLNGRLDLLEAEAVADLINAQTEASRKLALNQLTGKPSTLIQTLRQELLTLIANIEVNIDYPEYEDIAEVTYHLLNDRITEIEIKLNQILVESKNGKLIKEGIQTIIVGRPNVGKSSLLNKLLEEEKAIVTNIPGTTRDIVEGTITLNGILLHLIDTAGIRKTSNIIEKIGVDKSRKLIKTADLIIMLLDNSQKLTKEDVAILTEIKNQQHIIFINKIDLQSKLNHSAISSKNIVVGDTISPDGLVELKNKIKQMFNLEQIATKDPTYISGAGQIAILTEAKARLLDIKQAIKAKVPIDLIEIDVRKIWTLLGNIIGETVEEDIIDQIFSKFCLGK